jgi:2-polyprenyl-6-methoxyphenol hydroxylase-like FAD-dependent oxidoreductase
MKPDRELTVAVVGSGMAGLATAYLLHHDSRKRYRVQVLEKVSFNGILMTLAD